MTEESRAIQKAIRAENERQMQELIDRIAREIFVTTDQAKRMLGIIKRAGWESPEEVQIQIRRAGNQVRDAFRLHR